MDKDEEIEKIEVTLNEQVQPELSNGVVDQMDVDEEPHHEKDETDHQNKVVSHKKNKPMEEILIKDDNEVDFFETSEDNIRHVIKKDDAQVT